MTEAFAGIAMRRKSIALTALPIIALLTILFCAALAPQTAFCAAADFVPLERLSDGGFSQRGGRSTQPLTLVSLHTQAVSRISAVFGQPMAKPKLIFLPDPQRFWPFVFNAYGTTVFAGPRACVIIGPEGQNVDVVAHELVHAEIFSRIGAWRRFTQLPAWFDEGAAMQVDYRTGFELTRTQRDGASSIRSAYTFSQFFDVSPDKLTEHFAMAKSEVSAWLSRIGRQRFYSRLQQMHDGKRFTEIWTE